MSLDEQWRLFYVYVRCVVLKFVPAGAKLSRGVRIFVPVASQVESEIPGNPTFLRY